MPLLARLLLVLTGVLTMSTTAPAKATPDEERPAWRLVIHGGAGVIERSRLTPEQDRAIRAALDQALQTGSAILERGGSALDAVEAAVKLLEDDPNFNAGRGAVFTYEGTIEHDAAIMDGRDRRAGALTGSTHTRHPVTLARRVMEHSPHVFLRGLGADQFSVEQGLEQVPNEWFHTPERRRQWEEFRARPAAEAFDIDLKYGTVGAVALDREGHVAAATSTGGLTGKRWGRIGDSPIIGAGTYADDRACAVSATGAGEFFIRLGVAHEICAQLRFRFQQAIAEAQASVPNDAQGNPTYLVHASEFDLSAEDTKEVVDGVIGELGEMGGTGGVIVVTPWGEGLYSFNTPGMYRGQASPTGRSVAIYGDEQ
jgi:beta-aspartyl-peptidase (threonine type)